MWALSRREAVAVGHSLLGLWWRRSCVLGLCGWHLRLLGCVARIVPSWCLHGHWLLLLLLLMLLRWHLLGRPSHHLSRGIGVPIVDWRLVTGGRQFLWVATIQCVNAVRPDLTLELLLLLHIERIAGARSWTGRYCHLRTWLATNFLMRWRRTLEATWNKVKRSRTVRRLDRGRTILLWIRATIAGLLLLLLLGRRF